MTATGQPSTRASPVITDRPYIADISKNDRRSTTASTMGRIL